MENLLEKNGEKEEIQPSDQKKTDIKQILMESPIYQYLEKEEVEKLINRIVGYFTENKREGNN
ncbi:MAG: hypothetical protein AAB651_00200 [Patescibacteria group bacterium]